MDVNLSVEVPNHEEKSDVRESAMGGKLQRNLVVGQVGQRQSDGHRVPSPTARKELYTILQLCES